MKAGVDTFFSQDFSALEESLAAGTWEVDGTDDDLKLYCAEAKEADPGAVMVTEGGSAAVSELVHRLQEGKGTQVTHLSMELVCEALDLDSNGTFTVGLAFDEDLEEAVLLAVTLRRPRPEPKLPREPGTGAGRLRIRRSKYLECGPSNDCDLDASDDFCISPEEWDRRTRRRKFEVIYQAGVSNGQTWKSAEDAEFFPVCKSSRALEAARLRQDAAWNSWKDIADGMMTLHTVVQW
ncbi:unnamed protein product [Effrenium voratum]|nr:unnamed protein product [Effrenium voratum]